MKAFQAVSQRRTERRKPQIGPVKFEPVKLDATTCLIIWGGNLMENQQRVTKRIVEAKRTPLCPSPPGGRARGA
ncbi:MAG TPA: hypothetical protein DCP91_12035 [Eggerthellaceae bacterium]|nr:hypothetical protein [Eggerthellaceae bacterium]